MNHLTQRIGILTLFVLLVLSGCGINPQTKGADDALTVFCSLEERPQVEWILNQLFNDTLFTPEPEPYYKVHFNEPEDFLRFKMFANLVVVSIGSDPTNPATNLAKRLLAPAVYEESLTGTEHLFLTLEPYARNQVLLVISGNTAEEIVASIPHRREDIKKLMEEQFLQRQRESLFPRRSQKKLEQKLFKKYQWSLRIPPDFVVVKEDAERGLYWLGREDPYRWLVVHWEPGDVVADSLQAVEYARTFPLKMLTDTRYNDYQFKVEPTEFNDWYGWRFTGLWESITEAKGGPFIAYLFYDGLTDRTYYFHLMIFHPGKKKYLLLRQLDIIAHTFYVEQ
ncbi:MAG: DUF4837 family protein [Fidelibacterota bacterium]